jgi:hypothetical protein
MQDLVLDMKSTMAVSQPPSVLHPFFAEHKELRKEIQNSSTLQYRLEDALGDPTAGFDSYWEPIGIQFSHFRLFACGLATVFSGSPSVESNFPILAFDKNNYRSSLASISVEGQFHARQWVQVEYLAMLTKRDAS